MGKRRAEGGEGRGHSIQTYLLFLHREFHTHTICVLVWYASTLMKSALTVAAQVSSPKSFE